MARVSPECMTDVDVLVSDGRTDTGVAGATHPHPTSSTVVVAIRDASTLVPDR